MAFFSDKQSGSINMYSQEEHPRSNLSKITNGPKLNEEFITQISEEIEGSDQKDIPGIH